MIFAILSIFLILNSAFGCCKTISVSTPLQFFRALQTEDISLIIVENDLQLAPFKPDSPITIKNRTVEVSSVGSPQLVTPPFNTSGAVTLDFGFEYAYIELAEGAVLTFKGFILNRLGNPSDPDLNSNPFPEAERASIWPTVILLPNSTFIYENCRAYLHLYEDCTADTINRMVLRIQVIYGDQYQGTTEPPGGYLVGNHSIPFTIMEADGTPLGQATLISNGLSSICQVNPFLATDDSSADDGDDDGGLSAGAWAGIGIALGTVALMVVFSIAYYLQKRRRKARHVSHFPKIEKMENGNVLELVQQDQRAMGYDSALRIRFGSLEGLELGALIGRGAHGRIYKGSFRGSLVAVKVVEHTVNEIQQSADKTGVTSEALMLTALSHPNIVTVYRASTVLVQRQMSSLRSSTPSNSKESSTTMQPGTSSSSKSIDASGSVEGMEGATGIHTIEEVTSPHSAIVPSKPGLYETWLVMEYCNEGSLEKALKKKRLNSKDGKPRAPLILELLMDVATGMLFLHQSANLIHADLKPANVLLTSNGGPRPIAKIADFGLSRMLGGSQNTVQRTQALGTVHYMSPELMSLGRLTKSADVYAFGILAWEAWCCELAFEGMTAAQVFFSVVQQGIRPDVPDSMPAELQALIERCWHVDEAKRPGFEEVSSRLCDLRHRAGGD